MFDQEYFKEHYIRQYEQLGSARSSVFLHDGTELKVRKFHEALQNYVLLEVYPDGDRDEDLERRRKPGGTDEVFYDRVAVPYGSIKFVWISVTEPEIPTIGFKG